MSRDKLSGNMAKIRDSVMGKVVSLTLKSLRKYTPLILIHSPVYHKEVLDSVLEPSNDKEEIPTEMLKMFLNNGHLRGKLSHTTKSESPPQDRQADLEESDISFFKRIVQEILDRGP